VKLVEDSCYTVADNSGVYRFTDPMSRTAGTMTVKKSGSYIWGMSTDNEEIGAAYVTSVEQSLRAAGLFK